jgi:phosphate/sulfate permease
MKALPGIVMFAPTTSLITYLSEKERIKCLKGSKVKQYGNDVVGSYKIILSTFLLPLTCAIHSGILYFALKKYTQFDDKTILKATIGLFSLQPIYALLFVKSYDSIKKSWKKLKYLFRRTFNPNAYS